MNKKALKMLRANILIGGILITTLIDTEAIVTCISEKLVNKNNERLQEYPTLLINGVTLVGTLGDKATRSNKQIYAEIDLLKEFRSHIDLDSKTISFPNFEGKPSIRIVNEEIIAPPEKETDNKLHTESRKKKRKKIEWHSAGLLGMPRTCRGSLSEMQRNENHVKPRYDKQLVASTFRGRLRDIHNFLASRKKL